MFNYHSIVGKLNFLENSTRLDIAYTTHQVLQLSVYPHLSHGATSRQLGKYLRSTITDGITFIPAQNK